ncbi:MAG: Gfo/Idh/MocA family oxidoreductase [Gemmataceae bacterium]
MNRHRILIVGVGSIGERHLRCFQATGRADVFFCEVNAALRQQMSARYGVEGHASLEEGLIDGRPVTAAVIATPAHLHVAMARRCLAEGCHLLIEKPLSVTTEGVDELRGEVLHSGKLAAVAYVYRAHPALAALRAALLEGRIGTPVEVVAVSGQHFPLYRPAYRTIYYRDRATGGGAVQDALTHLINAAAWLVGPPDRLVADIGHQVLEGIEVEDTVHVLTRHGQVMGSFSLNQHQAPNETTLTVIGDRGTARFEYHHQRWRWQTAPDGTWQDEAFPDLQRDSLFVYQAHQFLDAIERREPPLCSLDEAIATLAANQAILQSAALRTWEEVRRGY